MNLLTKGSLNHLTHQLKKTPEEHFADIQKVIESAQSKGISANVYLEDWSNGMRNSPEYVFQFLDFLTTQPILRVLLPDTLGVLTPAESYSYIKSIVERYPNNHFDFHAHNDYDLSIANVMEAIRAGAHGLHLTVNGMGERAGNAPLASAIAVLKDFMPEVIEDAIGPGTGCGIIVRVGRQRNALPDRPGDRINGDKFGSFPGGHEQFAIWTQREGLRSHLRQFHLDARGADDLIRRGVPAIGPDLSDRFAGGEKSRWRDPTRR